MLDSFDVFDVIYTSGFATTHLVVFLFVIAGGTWGEEDNQGSSPSFRYGGGWSGFQDITTC